MHVERDWDSMNASDDREAHGIFTKLKLSCVPILGNSALTPSTIPRVSQLLSDLISTLREVRSTGFVLTPSLIGYTFFPLSTILRRNDTSTIPDQVLEKIFVASGILWEHWWWGCDIGVWEQSFMLCSAVIGGVEGKGKGRSRDDETKTAAGECLFSLLRERTADEGRQLSQAPSNHTTRRSMFREHLQTAKFIPILGQTLNSLLTTAESHDLPLQRVSLRLLHVLISVYSPVDFSPSVLPGVVSCMAKLALGKSGSKKWANGGVVAASLKVMLGIIVQSVGDDICQQQGLVRNMDDMSDLLELITEVDSNPSTAELPPYFTARTQSWLRGTSAQLHIALNSLTPLVSHPSTAALLALQEFSSTILASTILTLPQTQPLLLSFLLSISNSTYPSVSSESRKSLLRLLDPSSKARNALLQTIVQTTRDNLAALPRLLPAHADDKVEHVAGLIEAVCRLTTAQVGDNRPSPNLSSISTGIGKLLGPTGGIEKWGWSLLSVLTFEKPNITSLGVSAAQLTLEDDPERVDSYPFPEVILKHVASSSARDSLVRMFRSLGRAAGDSCLYSVEWFTKAGRNGSGERSVAALWCACGLLEGVGDVSLDSSDVGDALGKRRSKRLEKLARGLTRNVAELWDDAEGIVLDEPAEVTDDVTEHYVPVEHRKGVVSVRFSAILESDIKTPKRRDPLFQQSLRKAFSLHLLAISAGILQARYTPLLQHVFYPVLHSLVSTVSHLSFTALAALNFITLNTSYASIANLLLSNFDYALDAVSRRLTRRWLDVDATKVLGILVRLVGSDIVSKAGDVVEECFDRLDDFHGYDIIVENLVHVLGDVITVVKTDEEAARPDKPQDATQEVRDGDRMDAFVDWFTHRFDAQKEEECVTNHPPLHPLGADEAKPADEEAVAMDVDPTADPPSTPIQLLTKQIVSRSMYFLTHDSPVIRARILTLLSSSVPVLPESALLPSIHHAWPFILNRLGDPELFVLLAAAELVESLATHVGDFMSRKIWDEVWPRFRSILSKLDAADATSALARRGHGAIGTESAYTHSHRLYRSLLKTMTAVAQGVQVQDSSVWHVILAFRRFLRSEAHDELQACARRLYLAIGKNNEDAVWLALTATTGETDSMRFLWEREWNMEQNVAIILSTLEGHTDHSTVG